jgi:hypothetical protein
MSGQLSEVRIVAGEPFRDLKAVRHDDAYAAQLVKRHGRWAARTSMRLTGNPVGRP